MCAQFLLSLTLTSMRVLLLSPHELIIYYCFLCFFFFFLSFWILLYLESSNSLSSSHFKSHLLYHIIPHVFLTGRIVHSSALT